MKPSNIRKLVQSQMLRIARLDDATKYFEKQKNALVGIKDTTWYQEISDYFYRLYDDASAKFTKVDPKDVWKVASLQAQMSVAREFLSFLDKVME